MAQKRIGGRTQASIADDGDGQAMPGRHLFDFCLYRAGIAVHKYLKWRAARRLCFARLAGASV
jgi:hypothetical protein